MSKDVTVVLAHGAWADGSSWSKVIERLRAKGIRAVAAPLPLTSLPDDVAALERTLDHVGGPVVLAGHAYAGGVIGSVTAGHVRALVYVAALAPDEGESVGEVFGRTAPHPDAPALTPDEQGFVWLPDEAFPKAFAQLATPQEQAVLRAVQRPIALAAITTPVGRPLWKDVPTWYLVAEQDRMIPAENQHFMADRMGATVRVHDVDHTPLVTAPDVVADLLTEVVEQTRKGL
ncbi:alpha/beta fold hydrolase [Streptacidiphilus fuscans]|uniref:Alpha/beta hydrolase n=1 Tax=Streptacidiphilus fuscans TaxID=2789292 RepID=A0A931AXB8_9ACTN|nr:alpha/beta hydrolase [Streptacidiphilus fuscans]MBF9067240.1 alpha/beta hydrolase [Streptacidiphilus fuscans]